MSPFFLAFRQASGREHGEVAECRCPSQHTRTLTHTHTPPAGACLLRALLSCILTQHRKRLCSTWIWLSFHTRQRCVYESLPCCALALTLAFGGLMCHMMLNLDLQGAKKKKKKMDWLKWRQWNWEFNINSDAHIACFIVVLNVWNFEQIDHVPNGSFLSSIGILSVINNILFSGVCFLKNCMLFLNFSSRFFHTCLDKFSLK